MAVHIQADRSKQAVNVDRKFAKKSGESTLSYGRKSQSQGEGVDVRPGTYDRNVMNPDNKDDEFPRKLGKNFSPGHVRSEENVISQKIPRSSSIARTNPMKGTT